MRILEVNEINYSVDDIIDEINNELGFSAVAVAADVYEVVLTNSYKLMIDFDEDILIYMQLDDDTIYMSEGTEEVEALVTACESSIEIFNIIQRMTGGAPADDYS